MNCRQKVWLAVGVGAVVVVSAAIFAPKVIAGLAGGAALGAGSVAMKYALLSLVP
jgi:hypothetical protein